MRADTLIVWTEPTTQLDIALSFQDAEGCEDIWQFICDVQRHLNNLPSESKWFLGRGWEVLMGPKAKTINLKSPHLHHPFLDPPCPESDPHKWSQDRLGRLHH